MNVNSNGYMPSITFHGQDLIDSVVSCNNLSEAISTANQMRQRYLLPTAFAKRYNIPRKSFLLLRELTEKMLKDNY